MLDIITKFTLKYINNHQKVDMDYIIRVTNIIISYLQLNGYVKLDLDNMATGYKNIAEYDCLAKTMCFNIPKVSKHVNYILNNFYFTNKEKEVLPFIIYLVTIFHELDHALRYKDITLNKSDSITTILTYSDCYHSYLLKNNGYDTEDNLALKYKNKLDNYLKFRNRIDNKYYELNPIENIAEVKAYQYTINILNNMPYKLDNIICFIYYNLYYTMAYKYLEYDIPLKYYFDVSTYKLDWVYLEGIEVKNKYQLISDRIKYLNGEEAMTLGCQVNKDDIQNINNKLIMLERRLK